MIIMVSFGLILITSNISMIPMVMQLVMNCSVNWARSCAENCGPMIALHVGAGTSFWFYCLHAISSAWILSVLAFVKRSGIMKSSASMELPPAPVLLYQGITIVTKMLLRGLI